MARREQVPEHIIRIICEDEASAKSAKDRVKSVVGVQRAMVRRPKTNADPWVTMVAIKCGSRDTALALIQAHAGSVADGVFAVTML